MLSVRQELDAVAANALSKEPFPPLVAKGYDVSSKRILAHFVNRLEDKPSLSGVEAIEEILASSVELGCPGHLGQCYDVRRFFTSSQLENSPRVNSFMPSTSPLSSSGVRSASRSQSRIFAASFNETLPWLTSSRISFSRICSCAFLGVLPQCLRSDSGTCR